MTSLICLRLERDGKFLDYGGGYGLFTRLMRDVGFDYYWSDPFTQNLFAKGFEFDSRYGEFELITCFETFEHFTDPMRELTSMMKFSSNIFLSTELLPIPIPSPSEWYYYAPETRTTCVVLFLADISPHCRTTWSYLSHKRLRSSLLDKKKNFSSHFSNYHSIRKIPISRPQETNEEQDNGGFNHDGEDSGILSPRKT